MNLQEIPIDAVLVLRQKVLWPNENLDFVKTSNDAQGFHFGVKLDGEWISCISLFFEKGERAQFRKFATLAEFQGKGYGSLLLDYSFNFLKNRNVRTVYCSARIEKQDFYTKFGMLSIGESYLKDGLSYIRMEMTLNQEINL